MVLKYLKRVIGNPFHSRNGFQARTLLSQEGNGNLFHGGNLHARLSIGFDHHIRLFQSSVQNLLLAHKRIGHPVLHIQLLVQNIDGCHPINVFRQHIRELCHRIDCIPQLASCKFFCHILRNLLQFLGGIIGPGGIQVDGKADIVVGIGAAFYTANAHDMLFGRLGGNRCNRTGNFLLRGTAGAEHKAQGHQNRQNLEQVSSFHVCSSFLYSIDFINVHTLSTCAQRGNRSAAVAFFST